MVICPPKLIMEIFSLREATTLDRNPPVATSEVPGALLKVFLPQELDQALVDAPPTAESLGPLKRR